MQLAPASSRPVRSPGPAVPPIESLQSTHHELLLALDQLTRLLRDIDEQGATPELRAIAHSLTRFLDETGRSHHAQEERSIFPALLASGDVELVQHVRRLQQDHGWLEEDWLELGPQLDALAHGIGGVDLASMAAAAEVFSALYREHIALEENVVYPEARLLGVDLEVGACERARAS
jgi:hemerythrin-like domain-containing protein